LPTEFGCNTRATYSFVSRQASDAKQNLLVWKKDIAWLPAWLPREKYVTPKHGPARPEPLASPPDRDKKLFWVNRLSRLKVGLSHFDKTLWAAFAASNAGLPVVAPGGMLTFEAHNHF
jgi:hypothetical protein